MPRSIFFAATFRDGSTRAIFFADIKVIAEKSFLFWYWHSRRSLPFIFNE